MAYDPVEHPYHYTQSGYECIDIMQGVFGIEYVKAFCLCNAFKYIFRCKYKNNTIEDIKKANWYLNKFLELIEKENEAQNPVGKQD